MTVRGENRGVAPCTLSGMREYLINADFDLSLRPGWPTDPRDARSRQADELPSHLLLLGIGGDTILVPEEPEGSFRDYLERHEIPRLRFRALPSISRDAHFVPFGWNVEAIDLNRRYEKPSPHPPLDVVRRVNGRQFAAEVESRHWDLDHSVGCVRSLAEIERALDERPRRETGWLLKSEHGNGAVGHRRLRSRVLESADRETIGRLLSEDESAILELWLPRIFDLASVFHVGEAGTPVDLRHHQVVNTADGAFIGDIFDDDSPVLDTWAPGLQRVAEVVALELSAAGYFGPVCVDSFVWDDDGTRRLRPVADINARLYVAAGADRLWRSWGRDRIVYWRLFSSRKLRLPKDVSGIEEALGDDAFDPRTRCGLLVTSPLRNEAGRLRRIGVLIAGRDRHSIENLDRRFRERFEK